MNRSGGPLNIEILVQPLTGPRIVQDYLGGAGAAPGFFSGRPDDLDSFRRKLHEIRTRFTRADRERAARALRPTSERARERLDRFVREGGAMITTGQQSGLFTGPLYTIYKALTAVRLAAALERELQTLVLPVFWNASEDHDWAEVNHTFASAHGDLRRIQLHSEDRRSLPMSARRIGEGIRTTLDQLAQAVGDTEYGERYLMLCREAYRPGQTMAGAFAEVMAELLSGFDLLLADAADPELKHASAGVLSAALEGARQQQGVLTERTAELLEAGYHAQVPIVEGATNVFYHGSGERERLDLEGSRVVARGSGTTLDLGTVTSLVSDRPELFSPNVFLRPVVESRVFPTLAYVGGPGELGYFAQLAPLFEHFGFTPPVVCPRASLVLLERWAEADLTRLDLRIEELKAPRHRLVETLARRAVPPDLKEALSALSRSVSGGYRLAIEEAVRLDPTLAGALGSLRNESLALIGRAERKILRRIKALESVRLAELDRVRGELAPGGEPQERVLNFLPFAARHGPGLLPAIHDSIHVPLGTASFARGGR